jgi:hypothetical protein
MDEALQQRLVSDYLARSPDQSNSREIVRELAASSGLSEGKIRAALVRQGVYVSQPRKATVATPEQKEAILDRLRSAEPGTYVSTIDLAQEFNLTWAAVDEASREFYSERYQREEAEKYSAIDRELTAFWGAPSYDKCREIAARHGVLPSFVINRSRQGRTPSPSIRRQPNSMDQFSHLPSGHRTLLGVGNVIGNGIQFVIIAFVVLLIIGAIMSVFD